MLLWWKLPSGRVLCSVQWLSHLLSSSRTGGRLPPLACVACCLRGLQAGSGLGQCRFVLYWFIRMHGASAHNVGTAPGLRRLRKQQKSPQLQVQCQSWSLTGWWRSHCLLHKTPSQPQHSCPAMPSGHQDYAALTTMVLTLRHEPLNKHLIDLTPDQVIPAQQQTLMQVGGFTNTAAAVSVVLCTAERV